jgi:hypothetical protein
MNVADRLQTPDLERYKGAFHENVISDVVLLSQTAEDLSGLRITSVRHCHHLLDATATLRSSGNPAGDLTIASTPGPADGTPHLYTHPPTERQQITVMFCDIPHAKSGSGMRGNSATPMGCADIHR